MTGSGPPPRTDRVGRLAFLGLALFGSAAVGYVAGGIVGYPLIGLAVCVSYPLWVLARGSGE